MATLITNRQVVPDTWLLLKPQEDGALPAVPPAADVIVPLPFWLRQRETLVARPGRVGVWLEPTDEPGQLASDVGRLALITVNFPKFGDGRGYSTARLLRERYGYRGELRAVGDVLRDQLYFMAACGFDLFLLRSDQRAEEVLKAFDEFSEQYQATATQPLPLFRRRVMREAISGKR
jgi:uncharacterized protein (DUF934 family)